MTIEELLDKCENAYFEKDYRKLLKLSEEVPEKSHENPIAVSYRAISHYFLKNPQKALEILSESGNPENHYHRNYMMCV